MKREYPSPERIRTGEVLPGRCQGLGQLSVPRGKKTLCRSNKAAEQEWVWCMAKTNSERGRYRTKEKPPDCCNSSAARHVSENADAICNQSNREGSETQDFFLNHKYDRRYGFDSFRL